MPINPDAIPWQIGVPLGAIFTVWALILWARDLYRGHGG